MSEAGIPPTFQPTKLIVLSELSSREKEKYFQFLLMNQSKFRREYLPMNNGNDQAPEVRYIANVRLLAPNVRKPEEERKKKETSNYAITFQDRLIKLRNEGFIQVNVVNVDSSFDYRLYPRFTSLIANRFDTVRPKLRPMTWVMKHIEDIYDTRFEHEKNDVEREEDAPSFDLILLIFPVFVVRRLGTNKGLKSIVDQLCWDLLYSIHVYRRDYLELEVFGRFLQEFYDHDDLLFYLYVRSVINKVLHINFKTRWLKFDGPGRQPKSMWMSYREAVHIARIVFGTSDNNSTAASNNTGEDLFRDFMALITPQMIGEKTDQSDSRRIDITEFLHLTVVGYHQSQSRVNNNNPTHGNERLLVPIPGQILPPEPVPTLPYYPNSNMMQSTNVNTAPKSASKQKNPMANDTNNFYANNNANMNPTNFDDDVYNNILANTNNDMNHNNEEMQEAYDLDEEERNYQQEYDYYTSANNNNSNKYNNNNNNISDRDSNLYNLVNQLPIKIDHEDLELAAALNAAAKKQSPSISNNNAYENYGYMNDNPYMQSGIAGDNNNHNNEDENQMYGEDVNAFEALQDSREMEFISQVMQPLGGTPQDVYAYVEGQLKDQLHQTVTIFLADQDIQDLAGLDNSLLEILQLDQLRVDMEALRDDVVLSLMPNNNNNQANDNTDGMPHTH